jgi:hypothetical protein
MSTCLEALDVHLIKLSKCANSLGLQVKSDVAREIFSTRVTQGLISNSREIVEKALSVLVKQSAKKSFLCCVPNSTMVVKHKVLKLAQLNKITEK